jgi:SAM-dependent methyltransferase
MNKGNKEWGNLSTSLVFFCERKFTLDSKVLDVGCYTGSLIHSLFQMGFLDVYGIEVDQCSVTRGQELHPELKARIISYDGKHLPFPDAFFDVVTMFDVLEHIIDLEQFLEMQVNRVLKPGGTLVFQTPNKYTNIPWEILIHRSFSKYKSYHMSLQSYCSLKRTLHNGGFRDIVIVKRNIMHPYYLQPLRRYLGIMARPIAAIFNSLPSRLATNFWGYCIKLTSNNDSRLV